MKFGGFTNFPGPQLALLEIMLGIRGEKPSSTAELVDFAILEGSTIVGWTADVEGRVFRNRIRTILVGALQRLKNFIEKRSVPSDAASQRVVAIVRTTPNFLAEVEEHLERLSIPEILSSDGVAASSATTPTDTTPIPSTSPMACLKCSGPLVISYDERKCSRCSWIDHSYKPDKSGGGKTAASSGILYNLRYVGNFPNMHDIIVTVQVVRVRNRVQYQVQCPFCLRDFGKAVSMTLSSLSGKRREAREERYKCIQDHRISLTPMKDKGSLGWK